MKKWIYEGWHFIEIDGQVYILADDVKKQLDELIKKLEAPREVV